MSSTTETGTVREAIGVFFEAANLEAAVGALRDAGFSKADLGLLAGDATVRRKLGHIYEEVNDPSGRDRVKTSFVGRESTEDTVHAHLGATLGITAAVAGSAIVATAGVLGGALAVGAAGAAAVGGFGAVAAAVIGKSDADKLQEQIDSGHILLFVRTPDPAREKQAVDIMENHSGFDVKVYDVPAGEGA